MSEIHQLQEEIKHAKAAAEQRDRMLRLLNNTDFRHLILDGFCTEECARYVQVSVEASIGSDERSDALGMAQAAGYLKRWLQVFMTMSERASDAIPEMEATLAELRAEPSAETNQNVGG